MGSITGERRSSQARHTWEMVAPSCLGHLVERAARPGQLAAGQGEPRDEADPLLFAVVDHVVGAAEGDVVLVLHTDHRHDPAGRLDLGHADLGQPHLGHLPLVAELLQDTELVVGRDLGVDPVQLEEIDPLHAQAAEAALALLAQVVGATAGDPLPRARSGEPGLGGDPDLLGIGVERLADQLLGHVRDRRSRRCR